MGRIEKTVFISYRRDNKGWALAVYQSLRDRGYDVFFDYQSINSGDFEQAIIQNIKGRAHFLLLLTPTALERCNNPEDWLRREIEIALKEKRNIVPLFLDGFSFSSAINSKYLTGNIAHLKNYNGLDVPSGFFDEAIEKLCQRFLNTPLNAVLHPMTNTAQRVVKNQIDAANQVSKINRNELAKTQQNNFKFAVLGADSSYLFCYNKYGYVSRGLPEGLIKIIREENADAHEFKSIALGTNSSYVYLGNFNGYAYSGIPNELANTIQKERANGSEFKSIALGSELSYVFFYGKNGYAYSGISNELGKIIKEKNEQGVEFISISLGPNGSYIFLYNFNGYAYKGIPKQLANTLDEKYSKGFEYKSVALGPDASYVFLFGQNGYSYRGIPDKLGSSIDELYG
jgi:uncharacterized membrane protein SpoIIM required for sporulation